MKYFFFLFILIFALFSAPAPAKAEIHTVPYVDVNKYLGDWYQIAHIPLWFEGIENCACARQRLTARAQVGVIGVLNTCTKSDGSQYSISGTASAKDRNSKSKLTVAFEGVPFEGTYWIIVLDPQYRYAAVTDRGGDALYILSKTPSMPQSIFDDVVKSAAREVNTSKLVLTQQAGCKYPN